jgi:hypothetical protein
MLSAEEALCLLELICRRHHHRGARPLWQRLCLARRHQLVTEEWRLVASHRQFRNSPGVELKQVSFSLSLWKVTEGALFQASTIILDDTNRLRLAQ